MRDADTFPVREHIARARVLLRRQNFAAAMRVLSVAMSLYADARAIGAARYEIEGAIREALDDCNRQTQLRDALTPTAGSAPVRLRYVRGREAVLARLFADLAIRLERTRRQRVREQEQRWLERRQRLADRARKLLDGGELSRGLAFIHRLLEEYGDDDPDLHLSMAESLCDADLPLDGAELLSQALDRFPGATSLYTAAIEMYAGSGRLDKAEAVFRRGLRRFGAHPRNLLDMARVYAEAGQRARALSLLYRLIQEHPECEDAKNLLRRIEFRRAEFP